MRTALIVVLAIVVSAGCGGGDDKGSRSAAETAIEADAQERAESVLLQLSDFPDGWRASTPDEDDAAAHEKFRTCIGVDFSGLTLTGDAESRDFAKSSADASSEASVFEDADQAQDAVAEFASGMSGAEIEDCIGDFLTQAPQEEGQEYEVGEVDVGELNVTPPDVEQTSAWQLAVTVKITSGAGAGFSPVVYLDMVYLREGDTVAMLEMSDVLTPFDSALRDELLQVTAARMSE